MYEKGTLNTELLFTYGSAVRKIMYITNTVEGIHASFRKVINKRRFPSGNALFKVLYLQITELDRKWNGSRIQNWAMVRNQLDTNEIH